MVWLSEICAIAVVVPDRFVQPPIDILWVDLPGFCPDSHIGVTGQGIAWKGEDILILIAQRPAGHVDIFTRLIAQEDILVQWVPWRGVLYVDDENPRDQGRRRREGRSTSWSVRWAYGARRGGGDSDRDRSSIRYRRGQRDSRR